MRREMGNSPNLEEIGESTPESEEVEKIKGRQILPHGRFSLDNKKFNLGSRFEGATVIQLTKNAYGIAQDVDGETKITHIFQIPPDAENGKNRYVPLSQEITGLDQELPDDLQTIAAIADDYNQRLESNLVIESGQDSARKSSPERKKEFLEQFIPYLKNEGVIEYGPDGEIICDLEKIKNLSVVNDPGSSRALKKATRFQQPINWQAELINYFHEKLVYSRADWQKRQVDGEKIKPKPLFYTPQKDQVFDIAAIRQSDFYLSISDVPGTWPRVNKYYQKKFGYSGEEAELALRVYHPHFGNGYRNDAGQLMVEKMPGSNEFMPINSDWLTNKSARSGVKSPAERRDSGIKVSSASRTESGNQIALWSSPRQALNRPEYKNLKQSGILTLGDFRQWEGSRTSGISRDERSIGLKGSTSATTFFAAPDGKRQSLNARYTLGTEFEGKRIVYLAENLYGIVEETQGFKKVTHIFHPATPEQIKQKHQKYSTKYGKKPETGNTAFGKREESSPRPVPFSSTEFSSKQRQDEKPEEYAERIATFNAVKEYNKLQQISKDLTEQAHIGIHNLSLQEQNALTSYALENEKNYQKAIEFAKKFGEKGLKTFLACEYGMQMGNIVMDIGQNLAEAEAKDIFVEYSGLVEQAEQIARTLESSKDFEQSKSFDPIRPDFLFQAREAITRRAKDVLYTAEAIAKHGKARASFYGSGRLESRDINEVKETLQRYRLALEQVSCLVNPTNEQNNYQFELQRTESGVPESYNFMVQTKNGISSFLAVQLREYGAALNQHNPSREFDGEARINFLFSDKPISLDINDESRIKALSLRFDREGKERRDGKIVGNDPTRKEGEVSLEIGSASDTVGRVVSIGNSLSQKAENPNLNPQYYHNRESFNKNLGDAETFAEIVRVIRQKINQHFGSQHKDRPLAKVA